ncbi:hypothetical protein KNE206_33750 [Kitasatospora sp. NE20-6]
MAVAPAPARPPEPVATSGREPPGPSTADGAEPVTITVDSGTHSLALCTSGHNGVRWDRMWWWRRPAGPAHRSRLPDGAFAPESGILCAAAGWAGCKQRPGGAVCGRPGRGAVRIIIPDGTLRIQARDRRI